MQDVLCDEKWVCLIISLENEVQDVCNRGMKSNGQTIFKQSMSRVKVNRLFKNPEIVLGSRELYWLWKASTLVRLPPE